MIDCKHFKKEDVTSWHSDVFDHPCYKYICKLSGKEVFCNRNCMYYEPVKHGKWIYWRGWCGNHDMRIDDAVCSECGYEHPTVRWEYGDPKGSAAYDAILNKLSDECPKCGALMEKE